MDKEIVGSPQGLVISKRQWGFTLIELLIVIAIIAILAAIAIPMFLKYKQGAYLSSVRSDIKNSVTAVEAFSATYGDYPTTTTSCGPGPTSCALSDGNNTSSGAMNVSAGNTITITWAACGSGTAAAGMEGYTISGSSSNITSGPGSSSTRVLTADSKRLFLRVTKLLDDPYDCKKCNS